MNNFLRFIGFILLLLVVIISVVPLFLPSHYAISKQKTIDISHEIIFDEFNNLKKFSTFFEGFKKDSSINLVFFTPFKGKNANLKWNTLDNINHGDILNTASYKDSLVQLNIHQKSANTYTDHYIYFKKLDPNKTLIRWNVKGEDVSYFKRILVYFTRNNKEELIDNSFQNLVDKFNKKPLHYESFNINLLSETPFPEIKMITIKKEVRLFTDNYFTIKDSVLGKIKNYLINEQSFSSVEIGNSITIRENWDVKKKLATVYFGYIIFKKPDSKLKEMELITLEKGKAIQNNYFGNPIKNDSIFYKIEQYATQKNLNLGKQIWEIDKSERDSLFNQKITAYQKRE